MKYSQSDIQGGLTTYIEQEPLVYHKTNLVIFYLFIARNKHPIPKSNHLGFA